MQDNVVIDASSLVALVLPEQYSEWVEKQISEVLYIHAPSLIAYEASNALWKKHVLLRIIDEEKYYNAVRVIEKMLDYIVNIHDYKEFLKKARDLALKEKITIYEASYIALAIKLKTKLITLDKKLKNKVSKTLKNIIITPE